MDYNGARPKEKRDTSRKNGRNTKEQHLEYQLPSGEGTSQFVQHLSVRLCDVLDKVGASAEFRKLRQDNYILLEILETLSIQLDIEPMFSSEDFQKLRMHRALTWEQMKTHLLGSQPASNFIFGSLSEGTSTTGMNSDMDVLYCHDHSPVVANISDSRDGISLLMIRDNHTQPGYVKLQRVNNGQPVYTQCIFTEQYGSDSQGRICMKHTSAIGKNNMIDARNGPADTDTKNNQDNVVSFRCSKMHESSTEWIVRKRYYKWPSKRLLGKMV